MSTTPSRRRGPNRGEPYYGRARHRPTRAGLPPIGFHLTDATLDELAAAAHALVVDGVMDGALALSYVVWPDGLPSGHDAEFVDDPELELDRLQRAEADAAHERLRRKLGFDP